MAPVSSSRFTLYQANCLPTMAAMPAQSVDAIITDPPYFKVKAEQWDRQWQSADAFAVWLAQVLGQFARLLKPNGSLYLFASPQMAARVELLVAERMRVLNHIVWLKPQGTHLRACRAKQRQFHPQTERIIFAEQYGAKRIDSGATGYAAQCSQSRSSVFEPLRAYLDEERKRAGWSCAAIDAAWRDWRGNTAKGGMSSHWFGHSQWALPTETAYLWLRHLFNHSQPGGRDNGRRPLSREHAHLQAEYQLLRQDYEELKQAHQQLRRPFHLQHGMPYTDVWQFPTVPPRKGKHPCEKPLDLMRHIVASSTRPGQVVLDAFMGSGSTGVAALEAGCRFIGIEQESSSYQMAQARLKRSAQRDDHYPDAVFSDGLAE
ncbi:site-specific DNA-methyltransferase [Chitinimonas arctica]|uniref:Methyltransferase n=1 Tax=Chitinimonas arctica TaxID=2594795 RepID=A0A516SHQ5_9NEIS|nr:site-specific DNA-methyltransferase [Chitinimonas arctica]QDQ27689.1 site-specific DNA-methyltransferase [Chitinimonas arctica]